MEEPKKMPTRTPEQLSTLERMLFGIGFVFGIANGSLLDARGAPLKLYFISALPLLPLAFVFAYQLTFKDVKSAARITALNCGGYLVGEAAQTVVRNYF